LEIKDMFEGKRKKIREITVLIGFIKANKS